jgi:hypothetical protein
MGLRDAGGVVSSTAAAGGRIALIFDGDANNRSII